MMSVDQFHQLTTRLKKAPTIDEQLAIANQLRQAAREVPSDRPSQEVYEPQPTEHARQEQAETSAAPRSNYRLKITGKHIPTEDEQLVLKVVQRAKAIRVPVAAVITAPDGSRLSVHVSVTPAAGPEPTAKVGRTILRAGGGREGATLQWGHPDWPESEWGDVEVEDVAEVEWPDAEGVAIVELPDPSEK